VRLTAGGQTYTQPLTLRMDPRVKTPPEGLRAQLEQSLAVVQELRRTFDAKLEPLNRRLAQLYEILQEADAAPTTQAVQAVADLKKEVDAALAAPKR
jgi:hypothetical protein